LCQGHHDEEHGLDERFLVSNHIRRPRRVCRTRYG
jgi:hypothetical protein